ncbi:ribosomal l25 family protein [Besnoitia besnoiti]|uniref:Ribosomal l25 family protein n=1 Tax=Besnoitia besnoiti TaxID=94643 RepID=A0A2A9MDK2_BESBE|nr:ribosomal l25 family protein [Besnoitia besnoiti]PFH34361.1 ribosomal l25 family protein [Besnoitia besnoiti]
MATALSSRAAPPQGLQGHLPLPAQLSSLRAFSSLSAPSRRLSSRYFCALASLQQPSASASAPRGPFPAGRAPSAPRRQTQAATKSGSLSAGSLAAAGSRASSFVSSSFAAASRLFAASSPPSCSSPAACAPATRMPPLSREVLRRESERRRAAASLPSPSRFPVPAASSPPPSAPLSLSAFCFASRAFSQSVGAQASGADEDARREEKSYVSKNFKAALVRMQWPAMRQEMIRFFEAQNAIAFEKVAKPHPAARSAAAPASASASPSAAAAGRRMDANAERELEAEAAEKARAEEDKRGKMSFAEMVVGSARSSCGILGKGRSSAVTVECRRWERFVRKEDIQRAGYVPCVVEKYGVERRLAIERRAIEALAFEEAHGHLSHLFQARLFRLRIGSIIEECIATFVQADAVARRLYFVKFERHVPGKISEVDVPTTMVGLLACPAYQKGYHVELVMPTIRCQCVGEDIPPPFFIDVSRLHYAPPYTAVTLQDLQHLLPQDGSARFHPAYTPSKQEVVWAYEVGTLPDAPLPTEYVDPNFVNRRGQKMDVAFRPHFPN